MKKKKKKKEKRSMQKHFPDVVAIEQSPKEKKNELSRSSFVVKYGALSSRMTWLDNGEDTITDFAFEVDLMKLI